MLSMGEIPHIDLKWTGTYLGLGTPWEVVIANLHALNNYNCTNQPQVNWDLRLETPCEVVNPNFHALNG